MSREPRRVPAGLLTAGVLAAAERHNSAPIVESTADAASGFVLSQTQFEQIFPDRNPFYSCKGLVRELVAFPSFTAVGGDATRKREAVVFFANVDHETRGLRAVVEANTANYGNYCDATVSYGCSQA